MYKSWNMKVPKHSVLETRDPSIKKKKSSYNSSIRSSKMKVPKPSENDTARHMNLLMVLKNRDRYN